MAGTEDMLKTRTLWPPLVTLHLFFHSHNSNLHFPFLFQKSKTVHGSRWMHGGPAKQTSVPVDEAGETNRDQVKVVTVFALWLVGAEIVDRAACPPSAQPDRIRSPRGLTDDGSEGKREFQGNFIPPANVASGVMWSQCAQWFNFTENS